MPKKSKKANPARDQPKDDEAAEMSDGEPAEHSESDDGEQVLLFGLGELFNALPIVCIRE